MKRVHVLAAILVMSALPLMAQTATDTRIKIDFPPDVLAYFRANMHNRVDELDKIMTALAAGKMKDVASIAKAGLAKRGNHAPDAPRPGRYVPAEFRSLDQSMHDIADAVATAASVASEPPSAQDYQSVLKEVSTLVTTCNTCHKAYRIH